MNMEIVQNAWDRLGMEIPPGLEAEAVLSKAKLSNWNVRKVPLHATVDGVSLPVYDQFAVVRDNPTDRTKADVLGTVGRNYHVLQNDQLVKLLDVLAQETSAEFKSAGTMYDGRQVFVSMKMESNTYVRGADLIEHHMAVMSSHDGSIPTMIMAVPIRSDSQSLMNVVMGNYSNIFRFRHTAVASRISSEDIEVALNQLFNYYDEFELYAENLANEEMDPSDFETILLREFGPSSTASSATVTRREEQIDRIMGCYYRVSDHDLIESSAWAGFSALADWSDHLSPVRAGIEDDQDVRARKAITDPWFKENALKIIRAGV